MILFDLNLKFSVFKRFYIKSFFKFLNYSKLSKYKTEKMILKSNLLIYNNNKNRFQILIQYRPPLIIIIIFTYILIFFY